jgi:hypothetical protein
VLKEFWVTDCSEHFGEDLACVDRVVGVGDFGYFFGAVFVLICFIEALCLGLVKDGGINFESNFVVGAIPHDVVSIEG